MEAVLIANQLFFNQIFGQIGHLLQEPTLIHFDGSSHPDIDDVIPNLGYERLVVVSTVAGRPSPINPRIARSAVLLGRNPEALFQSLRGFRVWNGRSRVVVVVESDSDVQLWLSTAWRLTRAVNVVVAVISQPARFYTWFPYRKLECSNVSTIVQLKFPNIFPPKIGNNLHGCPFYGVTSYLPPLVFNITHGMESRIVSTISKKLNLNLKRAFLPGDLNVWLQLLDDKPVNGLKWVWDNDVDIMFSHQMRRYEITLWADMLTSYVQDAWKWYVPGPRPVARATAIFRAFSPDFWALVAGSFILLQLFCAALHYLLHGTFIDSFTRLFSIYLNLSTSWLPSPSFKVFAMLTYVYSLHITTAYQSSLIYFLSNVPRERPITTVEALANSHWPIFYHESLRGLVTSLEDPNIVTLTRPDRASFFWTLYLEPVRHERAAVLGPGIPYDYEILQNKDRVFTDEHQGPRVLTLKEQLLILHVTMYMSPGHPLVPIFDRYVQWMLETGLPRIFLTMDGDPLFQSTFVPDKQPFGTENVEGAFLLLGGLSLISGLLFLIELGVRKYSHKINIRLFLLDNVVVNLQ